MGSKKKIGRPKAPSFVLNIIRTKILQYRRRYKTTSWNAWTRLTTHKQFKELVKEFYKHKNNKHYHINRLLNNPEVQNKFYRNNIIKDRRGILSLVKTSPKDYLRYKK